MFAKKVFHQRLKLLRASRKMTAQELGSALGVIKQTVGHWETGKRLPDLPTIIAIADYFCVPIDYLAARGPYQHPFGYIPYNFVDNNNNELCGNLSYYFGVFPSESLSLFLYLEDMRGHLVSKSRQNTFYFLLLVSLINRHLNIGYTPDMSPALHQITLAVSFASGLKELRLSNEGSVSLNQITDEYENFMFNYLEKSPNERVTFLMQTLF